MHARHDATPPRPRDGQRLVGTDASGRRIGCAVRLRLTRGSEVSLQHGTDPEGIARIVARFARHSTAVEPRPAPNWLLLLG